ncbi:MAG: type II toxin-antitoxin system HicB family antitoxin [Methanoregula sp.]|jgi:predicted RNase H-like HicB family nuclease
MHNYALEIFYRDENEGFIDLAPELPGCPAFGETGEMTLGELRIAIDLWLETAKTLGRTIPRPWGKVFFRD